MSIWLFLPIGTSIPLIKGHGIMHCLSSSRMGYIVLKVAPYFCVAHGVDVYGDLLDIVIYWTFLQALF